MTNLEFQDLIEKEQWVLTYMTSPSCGVCHALLPQIKALICSFPELYFKELSVETDSELVGQYLMMSVPTLCIFYQGKEVYRAARFINIRELEDKIRRFHEEIVNI